MLVNEFIRHSYLNEWEIETRLADIYEVLIELSRHLSKMEEIVPTRRYALKEAATFLGVSQRTLIRRSNIGRLNILRDGIKPFITGAEVLRYARETGRKRNQRK